MMTVRSTNALDHASTDGSKIILVQIIIMRKIILAFDGDNFSEGGFEFARNLNEQDPVLLTGVFLPPLALLNPVSYQMNKNKNVPAYIPVISNEDLHEIEKNVEQFKMLCLSHGIRHHVHRDFDDFPLQELAKETRYADLMITGSEIFYEELGVTKVNAYLEHTLHHSECPVVVVPEKYDFPQNVILAYDGSKNSVFAIKQFAYLFPTLTRKQAILLYSSHKGERLPEKSNIEEWVTCHFPGLSIFSVDVDKKHFPTSINRESTPIVIAGSYGRTAVSQLFKKSFMTEIIRDHKTPVFIAHL